jgi:hypothetical protein
MDKITLKRNVTELVLNDYRVLISYSTPVAAQDRRTKQYYRTQTKYSRTTTRHINSWPIVSEPVEWDMKPQEYFDRLIAVIK